MPPRLTFSLIAESLSTHWTTVAHAYSTGALGIDSAAKHLQLGFENRFEDQLRFFELLPHEEVPAFLDRMKREVLPDFEPVSSTQAVLLAHSTALEAVTIALGHSILENHLHQALQLAGEIAPERWLPLLARKTATLQDFRDLGWHAVLSREVQLETERQRRNPLPKTVELLLNLAGSAEADSFKANDDLGDLYRLDKRRHELVHEPQLLGAGRFAPIWWSVERLYYLGQQILEISCTGHGEVWQEPRHSWTDKSLWMTVPKDL